MSQNQVFPVQKLTTKFLAETLGYTQQSIRNAFEALGIEPSKSSKGYVLTAEQATSVARHFGKDIDFAAFEQQEADQQQERDESQEPEPFQINERELFQSIVQTLQQQLEEKDKQIERLQTQLDTLLETNKAISASSAAKQVAETKELLIADKAEEPKKGFFARLFR